jgi:hypothetical protein
MNDHVYIFYIDLQDGNNHRIVGSSYGWVNPKTIKLVLILLFQLPSGLAL